MKTILALLDFSNVTTPIVRHAEALAKAFSSQLVLVHGVPRQATTLDVGVISPVVMSDPTPEQLQEHQAKLLEIRDALVVAGIDVSAEQYEGITVESILSVSQRLEADLIIMGSHHHNVLHDIFVGSITHDVLQRATCPVLVIPADAETRGV